MFSIDARVYRRAANSLSLDYHVTGDMGALSLPEAAPAVRADGLWRHTCFEVFIRTVDASYFELNLSPSGEWAAYRFAARRSGMRNAPVPLPAVEIRAAENSFQLQANVDLSGTDLAPDATWRLGLSVVMEEVDGTKSYWALAHPEGPPDFHHDDCFALELPPPSQT
jgi:hypothetical protein